MQNIFTISKFEFPYNYKFPGQASDEHILFAVRENKSMLLLKRAGVFLMAGVLLLVGSLLYGFFKADFLGLANLILTLSILGFVIISFVGNIWFNVLWRKSICLVTTKRLTKFVYTTPFNRHNLSLPLEQIVDTGSYTKGFWQALLRLGTFTARSSAASSGLATDEEKFTQGKRVNKKYFYIENVSIAEDLQHYINKLLEAQKYQKEKLAKFRPFIPHLKGEYRKRFMQQYPEYWS